MCNSNRFLMAKAFNYLDYIINYYNHCAINCVKIIVKFHYRCEVTLPRVQQKIIFQSTSQKTIDKMSLVIELSLLPSTPCYVLHTRTLLSLMLITM